jgi:hypothetical protein
VGGASGWLVVMVSGSFSRMAVNTLSCDLPSKARRLVTISSLKGQLESVDELAAKHLPETREWGERSAGETEATAVVPEGPDVGSVYGFFHSAVWLQPYSPAYAELRVVEITIL